MNWLNLMIALVAALFGLAWGLLAWRMAWTTGDYMIAFHPLFLLAFPVAIALTICGAIVGAYRKSSLVALSALVSSGFIAIPLLAGHAIIDSAWRYSIDLNSNANRLAVMAADLGNCTDTVDLFRSEAETCPVPGFKWYCDHHITAPNGEFTGFVINSVPHVYIQKLRGGFKGIALLNDDQELPDSDFEYQHSGIDGWYIWEYNY